MKLFHYTYGLLANCYLIADEESGESAVIDPGWFFDGLREKIDVGEVQKPKYILLTHGHFDHILGVAALSEYTGAKVASHEADAQCLSDPEKSLACETECVQTPTKADILLHDGDEIALGRHKLKVMHTPGHTQGSVCYIDGQERVIFSGDTLFCRTVGRTDFAGGSAEQMTQSIIRLRALEGDYTVYPGHNRETTLDDERERNIFMRKLRDKN